MDSYDVTAPVYQALEIVARYFIAIGDAPVDAQERALEHIIRLFNEGGAAAARIGKPRNHQGRANKEGPGCQPRQDVQWSCMRILKT
jgi:hypothetical protein